MWWDLLTISRLKTGNVTAILGRLSATYLIYCMIALQFRFFYFIIMTTPDARNPPINVLIVLIGG